MSDFKNSSIYVSSFDKKKTTHDILQELFTQAGPVSKVVIREDHAFVDFEDEESVVYACNMFNDVFLFDKPLLVKPKKGSKWENYDPVEFPTQMEFFSRNDESDVQYFQEEFYHENNQEHELNYGPNPVRSGSYNVNRLNRNDSFNVEQNFNRNNSYDDRYSVTQPAGFRNHRRYYDHDAVPVRRQNNNQQQFSEYSQAAYSQPAVRNVSFNGENMNSAASFNMRVSVDRSRDGGFEAQNEFYRPQSQQQWSQMVTRGSAGSRAQRDRGQYYNQQYNNDYSNY